MNTKITKWGNSLGLRINQEIADSLKLGAGSVVSLKSDERKGRLIVSPVELKNPWPFSEHELVRDMTPHNAHADLLIHPLANEFGE